MRIQRRIGAVEYTVWPERVPPMSTALSNLAAEWSSKHGKKVHQIRSKKNCGFKTFLRPAKVPGLIFNHYDPWGM